MEQTMQLKTITAAKEAGIAGIEFVKTDKAITEVIIGGKLRIRRGESYNQNLVCLIEQPFEEVERHRMTAVIEGFGSKVSYHEDRHDANIAASELASTGAETTVEKVTVHVNDDGEVVHVVGDPEPASPPVDELIPF